MEKTPSELWSSVVGELEVSTKSSANFNAWIKTANALELKDGCLILGFPTKFHLERFTDYFKKEAKEIIHRISKGEVADFSCQILTQKSQEAPLEGLFANITIDKPQLKSKERNSTIKSKYTFESFVVGSNNQLAHAAAEACSLKPGEAYNPLFIYGGPGLGKTHLMQAIGNQILENNPSKEIFYVTSEKFMNEFVQAVASGKMKSFKEIYRGIDVLLLDDVQFLAKKDSTLEEFFHTFNTLYQESKQIVISSDRPPKSLEYMPERLVSRFEGGMVVDIAPPDLETRIAILLSKCSEKNVKIENDILTFLAQNIEDNVRTLEGMLNKVIGLQAILGRPPTMNEVRLHIKEIGQDLRKRDLSLVNVLNTVSNYYKVSSEDILGDKRLKEYVKPRQIVMYLLKHEGNISYPIIGRELRGKDHTTIIHGVKKIEKEINSNPILRREITEIKELLYK